MIQMKWHRHFLPILAEDFAGYRPISMQTWTSAWWINKDKLFGPHIETNCLYHCLRRLYPRLKQLIRVHWRQHLNLLGTNRLVGILGTAFRWLWWCHSCTFDSPPFNETSTTANGRWWNESSSSDSFLRIISSRCWYRRSKTLFMIRITIEIRPCGQVTPVSTI